MSDEDESPAEGEERIELIDDGLDADGLDAAAWAELNAELDRMEQGLDVVAEPVTYGSCEEALEDAVSSLERVTAERDEYLQVAQRVQADFENYKRRVDAQRMEQVRRAAEGLAAEILPVLDGCEAAMAHGVDDVAPIHASLFGTLEKQGLERIDEVDVVFDPNRHEAVLSEDGEGLDGLPAVAEVMRAGYQWNGRVLRPAMVKVRG